MGKRRKKVAIAAISLGQDTSAEFLKYLTDLEIEQISQAISELDIVTSDLEKKILEEFKQHLLAGKNISRGGKDFAQGMLTKALGPRKTKQVLDRRSRSGIAGDSIGPGHRNRWTQGCGGHSQSIRPCH